MQIHVLILLPMADYSLRTSDEIGLKYHYLKIPDTVWKYGIELMRIVSFNICGKGVTTSTE